MQEIIVAIIFMIAIFWLGRFIYRQVTIDKKSGVGCDKCTHK